MKLVAACLVASVALVSPLIVQAEPTPAKDDVTTLLFDNPMWQKASAGTTLNYAFSKKANQASFGSAFDDHIVLKLEPGDAADSRTVDVQMFSGTNQKPAGPFRSEKQNPVLLLALENNVQELSKLFKANPRYLKNAIRKAWRENAKITDSTIEADGKSMPGKKITITPFAGDAEKGKMMGLDGLTYTVEISNDVPGTIAGVDIRTPDGGKAQFSETLRYEGEKKP